MRDVVCDYYGKVVVVDVFGCVFGCCGGGVGLSFKFGYFE